MRKFLLIPADFPARQKFGNKEFLKAASTHINRFLKLRQTLHMKKSSKNRQSQWLSETF
jgi:hypothetical protein